MNDLTFLAPSPRAQENCGMRSGISPSVAIRALCAQLALRLTRRSSGPPSASAEHNPLAAQMPLTRRSVVIGTAAATMVTTASATNTTTEKQSMYGLIGKMKCTPGQRDSLISILLEGVSGM